MKRMSPEARVGLLVLAGLLILIYMSFRAGKIELGRGTGYVLELELDNAAGLARQAEVLVAGIPVGRVEAIRLRNGKAVLSLRINAGVELPMDSRASLRTHGVLGEKYVEIVPGSSHRVLRDGDSLQPGAPPGDVDRLLAALNDIAGDVKALSSRLAAALGTPEAELQMRELLAGLRDTAVALRAVVEENRNALHESLANTEALTRELKDLVETNRAGLDETVANARTLTKALADRAPAITANLEDLTANLSSVVAENREDLRATLKNMREATGRFSTVLESVDSVVRSLSAGEGTLGRLIRDDSLYTELSGATGELKQVLDRLNRGEGTLGKLLTDDSAYAELSGSLDHLQSITDKIDRGEGTIGKLVNDESLHRNLNETLTGINEFVTGANRFQFELEYKGEFLAELGEAKHYFGLTVRPRQDRFYYVGLVKDPRGEEETKTTERTITDETGTHTVKEEETVTRDRLKFSVQIGKRFSFLTLRGGLFENTGGVAADLDFLSDRLGFSLEAFDFSRDSSPPHLKASARWTLFKHLFVTAGVDDFLDGARSDYFVGGGLRFLDEDLKYLLSPAASLAK